MKMQFEHHHHRNQDHLSGDNLNSSHNALVHQVDQEIISDHGTSNMRSTDDDFSSNRLDESFQVLDKDVPRSNEPTQKKLLWLRSQIIGGTQEFDTPFGRRRLTYADHTASGRSLRCIENYIATYLLPFYGNSHTSDSYVGYRTTKMVHEAANYVKKCLGGGEDDAIIFCGSGSTAAIKRLQEVMGIAIPSILRERSLAEVVEIGLDHRGLIDVEELRQKLDFYKGKNRPILGSFSACSNVTGIRTGTGAIARLLHQVGGFACFDFAASGPYTKIEMRSGEMEGYDAIFLSTHKFVGGPGSPGILLMSKALYRLGSSPPSTCGGGTVNFVNGYNEKDTIYADNIEEREDAGTPQIIQKVRAALAFWTKEYIGYKAIETLENSYIARALERLLPNPHIWVLGNTTAKRQPILSFLVHSTTYSSSPHKTGQGAKAGLDLWRETGNTVDKPLHGPFVAKLLNDLFGIQARGGCACAGPYGHSLLNVDEPHSLAFRSAIEKCVVLIATDPMTGYSGIKPGWTRVSFPYYMSEEEFEFILTAIEFIAIYGQRFLPWYHFSWRKGTWTFKKATVKDKYYNNTVLRGTTLASMIKELELQECKEDETTMIGMEEELLSKYAKYLETAKRTASLLPKFPPQRRVPEDIDIDLVPFRV
ncbi:UNVERIFIED_CONTAM: hypothetical protein Sradi_4189800 [Sesamum radiatum]|uniref:Aminotransferase class V domain-containing protein n=1 Tax=Sesamum radiatum TaxID=300843 RepID=A0AAW2P6X1_SESRA